MPQQELVGMKLFSIGEIIALTGLGRTTIYAEIAGGRLLAVKVGRRTLLPATPTSLQATSTSPMSSRIWRRAHSGPEWWWW